jgi:transcriptional regulator with XRE-family HTH domain
MDIFIIYAKILFMLKNISQTIYEQRKQRGWSQKHLADLCKLDRTTIGALERDDYQDLGIRKVERVLSVLGLTLSCESVGLPTIDDLKANTNDQQLK